MIKVGVFYPQSNKFDWDYYMSKHTPLVGKLLGAALKKVDIEKGVAGGGPGTNATYQCICNLHRPVESFRRVRSHAAEIMGDPELRDAQPVVQISEVKM